MYDVVFCEKRLGSKHASAVVFCLKPLRAKLTKWPNTLTQFVGNLPTNCMSVFGHFLGLALKMVRQIPLEVRNCLITKYAVLPLTTLLFRKLNFSRRTPYK